MATATCDCLATRTAKLNQYGIPPRLTTLKGYVESKLQSGSSSVVEHRLAKARVASSNLVSRLNQSSKAEG